MACSRAATPWASSRTSSRWLRGDDHDASLVCQDQVTGGDGDAAELDGFSGGALLQPAAGGGGNASLGEDREADFARLVDVPAGAVGNNAADAVEGGPQAEQPAPAGHVGAAVVGHNDHVAAVGVGYGRGADVGAGRARDVAVRAGR